LDNLFSDATLFKLNFIGIQHLEYLDIREIKTPEKPLTLGGLANPCTSLRDAQAGLDCLPEGKKHFFRPTNPSTVVSAAAVQPWPCEGGYPFMVC